MAFVCWWPLGLTLFGDEHLGQGTPDMLSEMPAVLNEPPHGASDLA